MMGGLFMIIYLFIIVELSIFIILSTIGILIKLYLDNLTNSNTSCTLLGLINIFYQIIFGLGYTYKIVSSSDSHFKINVPIINILAVTGIGLILFSFFLLKSRSSKNR